MHKPDKVEKAIFKITAEWFLDHPPIEEIGGFISQLISDYRDGFHSRSHALKALEVEHEEYIVNYIYRSSEILDQLY